MSREPLRLKGAAPRSRDDHPAFDREGHAATLRDGRGDGRRTGTAVSRQADPLASRLAVRSSSPSSSRAIRAVPGIVAILSLAILTALGLLFVRRHNEHVRFEALASRAMSLIDAGELRLAAPLVEQVEQAAPGPCRLGSLADGTRYGVCARSLARAVDGTRDRQSSRSRETQARGFREACPGASATWISGSLLSSLRTPSWTRGTRLARRCERLWNVSRKARHLKALFALVEGEPVPDLEGNARTQSR